jgi:2-C-methyl-D-erythritol 4-phosphate cytidylyltransferase
MGGIKKEYRPLPGSGLTVLGATVSAFAAVGEIEAIIIAVPADPETGEAAARAALPPHLLSGESAPAIHFVPGGATRRASVFNALCLLESYERVPAIVLIHDGARPWVSPSLIRRVIDGAREHQAVIPLMPITETPKETDTPLGADGHVVITRHLRRALVGTAQTPQGFAFADILAAHRQAAERERQDNFEFTDDAEIWASFCGTVVAIPGEPENRKITFLGDLE